MPGGRRPRGRTGPVRGATDRLEAEVQVLGGAQGPAGSPRLGVTNAPEVPITAATILVEGTEPMG